MKKVLLFLLVLATTELKAQQIQTTSVSATNRGALKMAATATIKYRVVKESSQVVLFQLDATVTPNASAGYNYNGMFYTASQIPTLGNLLRQTGATYPYVTFNIFYNGISKGSKSYRIATANIPDSFELPCSEAEAENTASWKLVATRLNDFNFSPDPSIWMTMEDVIRTYEKDQKTKRDYNALIREADELFKSKQYLEAQKKYYAAAYNYETRDKYPGDQLNKIKRLLAAEEAETQYRNAMKAGAEEERRLDYTNALEFYNTAAGLGISNDASVAVKRVTNAIDKLKKQQEDDLKIAYQQDKQKQEKLFESQKQAEAFQDKFDKAQQAADDKREQDEKDLKQQLNDKEEEQLQKKIRAAAEARKRAEQEEKAEMQKERDNRRGNDAQMIAEYERNMKYNPVQYQQHVTEADKVYEEVLSIEPTSALNMKADWWDTNPFMARVSDDLDEPKRQQAWHDYQDSLYKIENYAADAKYQYIKTLKYVDRGSRQQAYLHSRIDFCNDIVDVWKEKIKDSYKDEEKRKVDREWAKGVAEMNRLQGNHQKAVAAYSILTNDYLYPNINSKVKGSANALQRQQDFERRLNEDDQRQAQNAVIMGATAQVMADLLVSDKNAQVYKPDEIGVNLSVLTGYTSIPVINNETGDNIAPTSKSGQAIILFPVNVGMDIWFHRGKIWDIGITPDIMGGILPFAGYNNYILTYGANLKTSFGCKAIKLALEGDVHGRAGSAQQDVDVSNASTYTQAGSNIPITPTNLKTDASFSYTVLKVGAGLHINLSDEVSDSYLRMMVYAEKPSFYKKFDIHKPVYSYGLMYVSRGGFSIGGTFANNYVQAGSAKYPISNFQAKPFIDIKIGKTFTLIKTN